MGDVPKPGTIGWLDLTVPDAPKLRDFYAAVVGWTVQPVDMKGYSDYMMAVPGTGEPVAGVCHARGSNAKIPPVWLAYIVVENLDKSAEECIKNGGKVLVPIKKMGSYGRFCVIEDPVGAKLALFEPAP